MLSLYVFTLAYSSLLLVTNELRSAAYRRVIFTASISGCYTNPAESTINSEIFGGTPACERIASESRVLNKCEIFWCLNFNSTTKY